MTAESQIGELERLFKDGSVDKGEPHNALLAQANELLNQMRSAATTDDQREKLSIARLDLTTLFLQHRHENGNVEREQHDVSVALSNLRLAFAPRPTREPRNSPP